jgi:tetratricopeptide (TPR) repeat protein
MPSSESPEPTNPDRDESTELLRRQAVALERLVVVADPTSAPRKKFVARMIALAVGWSGAVVGAYQFGIFVVESHAKRSMVANWVDAAREMYEVEGSATEAGEMLSRAAELSPENVTVRKFAAYIDGMRAVERLVNLDRPFNRSDVEEYGRAMGQAVMLERVDPDSPDWAVLRGQLALAVGEPLRAEAFLKTALTIDPTSAFATLRLALVHWYLANAAKDPIIREREIAACRSGIDEALRLNPQFKWALLWKGVVALEVDQNPTAAAAAMEEALALDPRFVNALNTLGNCHKIQEQWEQAERAYARALAIRPDEVLALTDLAVVYGAQDKYEIGLRYARRATDAAPGSLKAWTMRGLLARELAKVSAGSEADRDELVAEAITAYSTALDLDPRQADAYIERSNLFRQTNNLQQAGEDARNAVLFGADDPYAWNALGKYLADAGFHEKAASTFDKVIELDGAFDTAYLDRARAHLAAGHRAQGAKDLDTALQKATEDFRAEILLERGKFHLAGGDRELALADFVAARKAQPEMFDAWIAEASVFKALGRMEEAKAAALEALQLRPGDETAKKLSEGTT